MNNRKNIFTSLFVAAFLSAAGTTVFAMNQEQAKECAVLLATQLEFDLELKNSIPSRLLRDFQKCCNMEIMNNWACAKINILNKKVSASLKRKENLHSRRAEKLNLNNQNLNNIIENNHDFDNENDFLVDVDLEITSENNDSPEMVNNNNDHEDRVGIDLGINHDESEVLIDNNQNRQQQLQIAPALPPLTQRQKQYRKKIREEKRATTRLNNLSDNLLKPQIKSLYEALEKYASKQDKEKIKEKLQQRLSELEDILHVVQAYKIISYQGFENNDSKSKGRFLFNDILTRYRSDFPVKEMPVRSGRMALKNFIKSFWQKALTDEEYQELKNLNDGVVQVVNESLDLFEQIKQLLS